MQFYDLMVEIILKQGVFVEENILTLNVSQKMFFITVNLVLVRTLE